VKKRLFIGILGLAMISVFVASIACGGDGDDDAAPAAAPAATYTSIPRAVAPTAKPVAKATAKPAAPVATKAPVYSGPIKRGGTFILGTPQQISTLDPHLAGAANNQNAKEGLLETFTRYTTEGIVGGHVFSSWDVSDDITTYTFKVQKGIKWHDGSESTAEDHRIAIQRTLDMESAYAKLYDKVSSVEAIGDTVVMTFPTANATIPGAFFRTYVGNPANIKNEHGGTAGEEDSFASVGPIGNGPFVYDSYVEGEVVTMNKFEDYWLQGEDGSALPYLDRVEVKTIPDATSLLAALKTGEVHFYWQLPPRLFGALQFDENANAIISRISTTHFYISFEHTRTSGDAVFADIRARRAVLLAMDKQEIVDVGYGGTARPILSNQYIPGNFPMGTAFPPIERDVEEAARLFKEVGITEIHFNSWDDPAWTPIGEALQSHLAEAGVELKLHVRRVADWSCAQALGDCGPDWEWNNMLGTNGSLSPPDPHLHIANSWMCPGSVYDGKWCNEEMDVIAQAAIETVDFDERKELYRQWNQLWIDNVVTLSYAQLPFYHGEHYTLKGIVNLFGMPFYEAAWLND
jgi:peptide/nickel transport system substrate-binding protein